MGSSELTGESLEEPPEKDRQAETQDRRLRRHALRDVHYGTDVYYGTLLTEWNCFLPPWGVLLPKKSQPRTYGWLGRPGSASRREKEYACVRTYVGTLSWMPLTWEQEVRGQMQPGSALRDPKWPVGDFEEGALC